MKIYISGPMTGIVNHNRDAFFEAEEFLQNLGHETVNPARLPSPSWIDFLGEEDSWVEYMKRDIVALTTYCDSIVMLDGWKNSVGAKLELHIAKNLRFVVFKSLDDVKQASPEEIRQVGMEPETDQPYRMRI